MEILCIKALSSENKSDRYFEYAAEILLRQEGGYVNDPSDSGGETKFGISKRQYPFIDIPSLTIEEAKSIYKRDFWDNQLYRFIDDIEIAAKVFSLSVNVGPAWAHKIVARAVRSALKKIPEDEVLKMPTIALINTIDKRIFLAGFRSESAGYYRTLAALSTQKKFLKGWLRRAYS